MRVKRYVTHTCNLPTIPHAVATNECPAAVTYVSEVQGRGTRCSAFTLVDLGGVPGTRHPYGTQFFQFRIHFCQKAPASGVHTPLMGPCPAYGKSWIRHCFIWHNQVLEDLSPKNMADDMKQNITICYVQNINVTSRKYRHKLTCLIFASCIFMQTYPGPISLVDITLCQLKGYHKVMF